MAVDFEKEKPKMIKQTPPSLWYSMFHWNAGKSQSANLILYATQPLKIISAFHQIDLIEKTYKMNKPTAENAVSISSNHGIDGSALM